MRKLITFIARVLACVMGWFRTKEEVVRTTTPTDPVAEHYSWADRFIRRWSQAVMLWDWRPTNSTCCKFSILFGMADTVGTMVGRSVRSSIWVSWDHQLQDVASSHMCHEEAGDGLDVGSRPVR